MARANFYDELGGREALWPIIERFVETMVGDAMIGFFFEGIDPARLTELEFQFTARFLGADLPYDGRPMRAAHRRHPIMGGQFDRRRRILETTIEAFGVPAHIRAAWLEHVDRLRGQITKDARGVCEAPETDDVAPPALRILS